VLSKFTINSVVFLLLTGFTVTVALIFKNPLLVYTAVFLVTTNIFLYIWAQYSVRGINVRRLHPNLVMATHPVNVEIELTNIRRGARYGILGFDLHTDLTLSKDYTPVAFHVAPANQPVFASYEITPERRGEFSLGPFYLYGGDPFGFYKCWRKVNVITELLVLPRTVDFSFTRPTSTSMLKQDELETIPAPGDSTEFFGVREYIEGESLRRVHWRTSARLGKLISRQYELNVASSISALVVADEYMNRGHGAHTPLEYSLVMIASVAQVTCAERFHFSYLALTGKTYDTLSGTGRRYFQELALHLAKLKDYGDPDWDLQSKIILNYLPKDSNLLVFIADMNETVRERLRNLALHFRNLTVITFNRESFTRTRRQSTPGPRLSFGESYLIFEVAYGDDLARVLEQVLAKPALVRGMA
jgi:uncharacterized protein (DUF58 family)